MEPQRFFETALPTLVVDRLEVFAELQGTLAVGVRGVGAWTLHLGDLSSPVVRGFDAGAQARLTFTRGEFAAFVAGESDALDHVRVRGDARVLADFARLMTPVKNAITARIA